MAQVGPVARARIAVGEARRSRGFAFCQYHGIDTASSAIRNLSDNAFPGNGNKRVRVQFADPGIARQIDDSLQFIFPHGAPMQPQPPSQPQQITGGRHPSMPQPPLPVPPPHHAGSAPVPVRPSGRAVNTEMVRDVIDGLPDQALAAAILNIKVMHDRNPQEARQRLENDPGLASAIFQSLVKLKLIESSSVQRILQPRQQQQQPPPQPPPPAHQMPPIGQPVPQPPPPRPMPPPPGTQMARPARQPPRPPVPPPHQQQQQQKRQSPEPHTMSSSSYEPAQPAQPPQPPQPPQPQPPAVMDDQIRQVLSLTEQQVAALPSEFQEEVRRIKAQYGL
ncbi:hypothetical protein GQ42DRAFT_168484 [Ramicandelaber brevisporus]|nr:hypothetical protein GQ42DRAFT_168484 [Ramicandelaber brevisporus]